MPGLKYYYDLMSQPSRAVYIFLKMNNIPFEENAVALRKGEHMTEEFAKVNPFQRVPVINDDGFQLTESVAILRYLCATRNVASHWYPTITRHRTRVDEYMAWQHTNTRLFASMVFRTIVIEPKMKQIPVDQEKLKSYRAHLEKTIGYLENVFLKDQLYLCGNDITIADLLGVCELMQPMAAGEDIFQGHDKLKAYVERVQGRLQPHFDEAHKFIYRLRDMQSQAKM